MGWSIGYDSSWERDIGYGVPAECDHPDCTAQIDRGLSYVCGEEPYGGDAGCGLYFCGAHRQYRRRGYSVCLHCALHREPFDPKPDVKEWVEHKLNDPSWARWRADNPTQVEHMKTRLKELTK